MDIENLIIENKPILVSNNAIKVSFPIDLEGEISISIDNSFILNNDDISKIEKSTIFLNKDLETDKDIVVIYYKI